MIYFLKSRINLLFVKKLFDNGVGFENLINYRFLNIIEIMSEHKKG